jgi:hypothetical protein
MNSDESVSNKILFREKQRFTQLWIWALIFSIIAVCLGLPAYYMVISFYIEPAWSPKEIWSHKGALTILAPIIVVIIVTWLIAVFELVTEVRSDGLFIRMRPFHRSFRRIPLEKARDFRAMAYRPIRDYGGWGLRFGKGGRAYNVKGDQGVRIDYEDGKHILIGSQRARELEDALAQIFPKKNNG